MRPFKAPASSIRGRVSPTTQAQQAAERRPHSGAGRRPTFRPSWLPEEGRAEPEHRLDGQVEPGGVQVCSPQTATFELEKKTRKKKHNLFTLGNQRLTSPFVLGTPVFVPDFISLQYIYPLGPNATGDQRAPPAARRAGPREVRLRRGRNRGICSFFFVI